MSMDPALMSPDQLALWATLLSSTDLLRIRVALESVALTRNLFPQVQHHQIQYQIRLRHQWSDDAQDGASFLVGTLRAPREVQT